MQWWLPVSCLGLLDPRGAGVRRPLRLQHWWISTRSEDAQAHFCASLRSSSFPPLLSPCLQVVAPTVSRRASITWTAADPPARARRETRPSASTNVKLDTRQPTRRTNTLVRNATESNQEKWVSLIEVQFYWCHELGVIEPWLEKRNKMLCISE